jgi:glycosyltransferase involved in cell wall biosynthesis
MGFPRVSVVIPAHNESAFIEKSVRSFLRQSLPPQEIIVVDDNSSDTTVSVCKALVSQFPLIKLLTSEVNGGPSVARNRGAEVATGDILCFAEADGEYSIHYLRRCVAAMVDSGCVVSGGGLRMPIESVSLWGGFWRCIFEARWHLLNTGRRPPIGGWLFPRGHFLDSGGYDPALRYGEDVDFVRRMLGVGCINKWQGRVSFSHNEPTGWGQVWRKFYSGARKGLSARVQRDGLARPLIKALAATPLYFPFVFVLMAPLITLLHAEGRIAWGRCFKQWQRSKTSVSRPILFPFQYLWLKLSAVSGILIAMIQFGIRK